jgi:hypothetical protein
MIIIVSGEGATDIGVCQNRLDTCSGPDFSAGPMTHIIDKLIEPLIQYSPLKSGAIEFVSERHLLSVKVRKSALRGKKRNEFDTAHEQKYFYQNARQLAHIAQNKSVESSCPVIAVLFRDTDGTHSTSKGLFDRKWRSMELGFQADGYQQGVPMIPKPKSEAWLLCAVKQNPYQNCNQLEDRLPANDASPNSAKKQLNRALKKRNKSIDDLISMVDEGDIDATQISMPSYDRFRQRLESVVRECIEIREA